jgi:curved DNA-binding protein CbpA
MENIGAIAGSRPAPEAPAPQPVTPAAAPEPPKSTKAPAPSIDEKQLADTIEKRFRELQSPKDYFARLGVPRSAGAEEIKASFLQLAKVFHPDRLPSSLQHLSSKITAIFEAVREAYETLQVESKRKSYLATLEPAPKPGQSKAEPSAEASDAFKRGDLLMKKKDFAAAEREYLRAYGFDPKPVYRASQAWAIYMDPARKAEAGHAKQMMAEALRADPACDRAHYQLGVICRVEGAKEKAEKHFREALRANPKHLDASQELRIIEMRKKKGLFR